MPHSQHGNDSKAKQKHRRSGSHISKGNKQKPQESSGAVVKSEGIAASTSVGVQQPPAGVGQARPWSPWIPGDDGRWFYQGRLKADGSGWEYQFTEGYPPASRRWQGNPYAAVSTVSTPQLPYGPPPILAGQTLPGANRSNINPTQANRAIDAPDISEESNDDFDVQEEDEAETGPPLTQQPLPQVHQIQYSQQPVYQPQAVILASPTTARPPPATNKPGSARQALVRHLSGRGGNNNKQLSAIVKADKERRVNSRKRIKSWLSEVTP
ncbi:hypothetical protein GE09DRAFT_1264847 [Coniochaeta sp. 2T2.1]|nr:hypothetical protein GE09DRAFT_1264847 [Coniochaeta sp. 2T2.1]